MTIGTSPPPVVVGFPLRGEWTAERTPAHRVPSHGTDRFGQRYAFDFVRPDSRRGLRLHPGGRVGALLVGRRTRDYYGWGQPVHAAFDGVVVTAVDGVPERARVHLAREVVAALTATVAFTSGRRGAEAVAGNHVIVRGAAAFALFAHLAPGSVAVGAGQQVQAGEVVGRVGHTGSSTAPHLHFQLMDSADPLQAQGLPCAFAAYLARRDGGWQRVERAGPAWRERIRSLDSPG